MQAVEYAPEYSRAERVRHVVIGIAVGALVVAASKLWFLPLLREFAATAHCRGVFGLNGIAVLFYGVCVGLPLFLALFGLVFWRRGLNILRQGRTPPLGQKMYRRTPVIRGAKARLIGYAHLFFVALLFGFVAYGAFVAQTMLDQAYRAMKADPSIERKCFDAIQQSAMIRSE